MHSHFIMISCWLYTQNIWIYPYTIYPPQIADNHQFHYIIYICVLNHSHPSIPQLLPVNSLFLLVPICSHYFSNISPCLPHPKKCLLISPYFARSYFKQTHTSIHIHIYICIYIHIYMYTYIYMYIYISEWTQHDIIHLKTIHIHVWNIWYIVIYIIRIHNIYIHHQWKLDL
jgi:hypothetical protein